MKLLAGGRPAAALCSNLNVPRGTKQGLGLCCGWARSAEVWGVVSYWCRLHFST